MADFAPLNELGFTGNQSVPIDSVLVFTHPQLPEPLRVRSGAHSIKWSYELNTLSTPTVGGEVVQILSCFVGPITIQGEAVGYQTGARADRSKRPGWAGYTPTDEAVSIMDWFLDYMHLAGTLQGDDETRNQAAIRFEYPARGWAFWIQVTGLQGFDFSTKQVTVPWSITAEVISDAGLDYFEAATMNTFTDDLTSRTLLAQAISPGYDAASNPFINPALNSPGDAALAARLGDNFQSLIASWAGANFMTWGFNPMGDPADIMSEDPYSFYHKQLGGEYLGTFTTDTVTDYGGIPVDVGSATGTGGSDAGDAATGPVPDWIAAVLRVGGWGQTQQNVCFLRSWQKWEGGGTNNAATFNFMNTTLEIPGHSHGNNPGMRSDIQAYDTFDNGVLATVKTIKSGNSGAGYPRIGAALGLGNVLDNWGGVQHDLNVWVSGPNAGGLDSPSAYTEHIRKDTEACTNAALAAPPPSSGLFVVTNTTPGDPFWGGSREIAERIFAVGASRGLGAGGRKDRGFGPTLNGNWSDHDLGMTVGYAIDAFGSTAVMDAAASAMAAACGKPWDFKAHDGENDWFDIPNANGYRIQIGWRVDGHYDHVHIGARRVG